MSTFNFIHPIEIRYSDLDPQWHVNNARILMLIEQARLSYLQELGLWDGKSFLNLGVIIADIHIAYKKPIELGDEIEIGVRVAKLGNKSILFENEVYSKKDKDVKATCEVVIVTYDFRTQSTIPIPDHWREVIMEFEGMDKP